MDCCAGLPPHESDSCAHGSCHVALSAPESSPPEEHGEHYGEQARRTGQHGDTHEHDAPSPPPEHASPTHHPHSPPGDSSTREQSPRNGSQSTTTSVVTNALTRPCPPGCGVGAFSYPSQRRPRDFAAAAYADRPRPPSGLLLRHTAHDVVKALADLCRRARPRGPPHSFS